MLCGLGREGHTADVESIARIRGLRAAPERPNHPEVLVADVASVLELGVERAELALQPTGRGAEDEAPARQRVHGSKLFGEHDGVAVRKDDDAGARRRRCVTPARKPSVVSGSSIRRLYTMSSSLGTMTWSVTQIESKPSASTRSAKVRMPAGSMVTP